MFNKKIGITQNLMMHPKHNEKILYLDSNWIDFLDKLGIISIPLPIVPENKIIDIVNLLNIDGLILTGGNTIYEYCDSKEKYKELSLERDIFEKKLIECCISLSLPIFGICRGMQLLNVIYGGTLSPLKNHVNIKHELLKADNNFSKNLPEYVNSYHNFSISKHNLAKIYEPLAYDLDGNIESFFSLEKKIMAIMWHPERDDSKCLDNYTYIKNHFYD